MNIFDILGPVMVGPSSSHTAGAVRIGLMARKLLKEEPKKVNIYLHGSFAATGVGHGTDKAIIAGLLGMNPDDTRIPHSFEIAHEKRLEFDFETMNIRGAHPNTALIVVRGDNNTLTMQASSLGGGKILVNKIEDMEVNIHGEKPTLIVHNLDQPGFVAEVTGILAQKGINIATMQLCRSQRGGQAVMIIETDQEVPVEVLHYLQSFQGIVKVTYIQA